VPALGRSLPLRGKYNDRTSPLSLTAASCLVPARQAQQSDLRPLSAC